MEIPDVTLAEMTAAQLKELIQSAVREALQEILGDADTESELRPGLEEKLRQAVARIAPGERPFPAEKAIGQLEDASYAESLFSTENDVE
jgi:hypothetical protein